MQNCRLFVDESGTFDDEEAHPVVAGVLMAEGPLECNEAWIRQLITDELPWLPWPVHGWVTRRPLMYALCSNATP